MSQELLTPQLKLWSVAKELWPRLVDRRPMHVQAIVPAIDEVLAIELTDELVGSVECRRPELKIARFIVDAETDNEIRFEIRQQDTLRRKVYDPFLEYYADLFSRIDIERSVA